MGKRKSNKRQVLYPFDRVTAVLLIVLAALSLSDAVLILLFAFDKIASPYPSFAFGFVRDMMSDNPLAWLPVPGSLALLQWSAGIALLKRRRWGMRLAPVAAEMTFLAGIFWIPASLINLALSAFILLTFSITAGDGKSFDEK